jgi:HD-GYP domain-containing protein (c-di-GMP phosphodiesterase class II)
VWSDAVGEHHEHSNRGGYPRGIAGTEISLAGRIVAVADVFDVITSTRSSPEHR